MAITVIQSISLNKKGITSYTDSQNDVIPFSLTNNKVIILQKVCPTSEFDNILNHQKINRNSYLYTLQYSFKIELFILRILYILSQL